MKPFTILVGPELRAEIEALAAREGRSLGSAARRLLEKAIAAQRTQTTTEGAELRR